MPSYIYPNGFPFSDPLAFNLDGQLSRVDKKKASCILMDGAVGMGKTTFATHLGDFFNCRKGQPLVELKIKDHPQLSLGGKEFTKQFRQCNKLGLPVIIYDEAGDFNRRGSITFFNQTINRLFEVYRGFRMIVIICLPNFAVLDSKLFENQVPRMLIHIADRNMNSGNFSAYSLSGMNWIRYWYEKLPKGAKNKAYSKVQPNFRGHFLNLDKEREVQLDKLSTHGKKEFFKESEKMLEGLVTYGEIAHKLNRSIQWVAQHIKQKNIKHHTTMGRVLMFKKTAIDILIADLKQSR